MYYYSAKTNSFYPSELRDTYEKSGSFPDDVVQVSESMWLEYAGETPPSGMVRVSGDDGFPKWEKAPDKTKADHIIDAEDKKQQLIGEVNSKTQIWQTQLSLKIIDDDDKSKLKDWMLYAKKVQAVDTAKAPDIAWPNPPKK